MKPDAHDEIKRRWHAKSTTELQEIWQRNDRDMYTDDVFSSIEEILQERAADIPPQAQQRRTPAKGKRTVFERLSRYPFESTSEIQSASKWPTIIRCTIWMPIVSIVSLFVARLLAGFSTEAAAGAALIGLLILFWVMGKVGPKERNLLEWRRWLAFREGVLVGLIALVGGGALVHTLWWDDFSQPLRTLCIVLAVLLSPIAPVMGVIVAVLSDKRTVSQVAADFEAWRNAGWQNSGE